MRDFVTPDTLYMGTMLSSKEVGKDESHPEPKALKSLPAYFDATGLEVTQHFATSKDGTRSPTFKSPTHPRPNLVQRCCMDTAVLKCRCCHTTTHLWVRHVKQRRYYVVANIRGGGEYGPSYIRLPSRKIVIVPMKTLWQWEKTCPRGITTSDELGIQGGSNGCLLMGNMYTLYPEKWGAIVCQVPLLDMKRYTKLLAGASWMGEYGDPDVPEEWEYIQTFSPYHNIKPQNDSTYPPMLITTSTRDDRVHPGHARKMTAALEDATAVLYYENMEGGHGGSANRNKRPL